MAVVPDDMKIVVSAIPTSKSVSLTAPKVAPNTSYTAGPTRTLWIAASISSSNASACHGAASASFHSKHCL